MRKYLYLILIGLIIINLVGCSTPAKPEGVRQEVWNESIRIYRLIDEKTQKGTPLTEEEISRILDYELKYSKRNDPNLTDEEEQLVRDIMGLAKIKFNIDQLMKEDINYASMGRELYMQTVKIVQEKYKLK